MEGECYRFRFLRSDFKLGTALCNRLFDALGSSGEFSLFILSARKLGCVEGRTAGWLYGGPLLHPVYLLKLVVCVLFPASCWEAFSSH